MLIRNCNLGDRVLVYIDSDGDIRSGKEYSVRTMVATLYAIDKKDDEYRIGWTRDDEKPLCAKTLTYATPDRFQVMHGISSITHRTYIDGHYEIAGVLPSDKNNDWYLFVNRQEGQCPCGTNRDVCIYHG